jgi:hypothetical protein
MDTVQPPVSLAELTMPEAVPGLHARGLDPAMLDALTQPRLNLFWGANTPTRALLALLTFLAARGHRPRVFDGGNRFDGYFVARLSRRLTPEPEAVLQRIRLSRAFTCFQLAELIENTATLGGVTPQEATTEQDVPSVLLVLDLLSTFYDESVPLREVERLLANTLTHLKRLASRGPVIVGAREPQSLVKERWTLLDQLQVAADNAWMLRSPEESPIQQPRLFE